MTTEDHTAGENNIWIPVFITEFLVISIINAITVNAFARIRHLRKRSTYLIINLTVADLLVGAIAGPLFVYRIKETTNDRENRTFEWPAFIIFSFELTFPITSQMNLCLISLERLHATLFPFRHCLIRKCFYFKVIMGSWFISFLLASLLAGLLVNESYGGSFVWASFSILNLLVIAVSYTIIILNVQSSSHAQNHGLIHTERKLSVTLFIVTGVSVLTILPWAIYKSMPVNIRKDFSSRSRIDIGDVITMIYISSSIVNPLVYVLRMQEFREAVGNLFCKSTELSRDYPLSPHRIPVTLNYRLTW